MLKLNKLYVLIIDTYTPYLTFNAAEFEWMAGSNQEVKECEPRGKANKLSQAWFDVIKKNQYYFIFYFIWVFAFYHMQQRHTRCLK